MSNSSSNTASFKSISLGSGWILKWEGSWEGQKNFKTRVSSSLLLSSLQERSSDTWFLSPSNHWLYDLMPRDMKSCACFLAASIPTNAWIGSSPSLLKFNYFSHPLAVVLLSVIERTQPWFFRWPAKMPTMARWRLTSVWTNCLKHGILDVLISTTATPNLRGCILWVLWDKSLTYRYGLDNGRWCCSS